MKPKDEGLTQEERLNLSFDCTDVLTNKGSWKWSSDKNARNIIRLIRQVNTLEAKCKWQEEMLERAKKYIKLCGDTHDIRNSDFDTAVKWLADLERGPKK